MSEEEEDEENYLKNVNRKKYFSISSTRGMLPD
jgi:hypothetical protein